MLVKCRSSEWISDNEVLLVSAFASASLQKMISILCLRSCLNQKHIDCEVIVVDDVSTDNSDKIIKLTNTAKKNKKSYNIFCYLNKKKQIALTKKNDLGFLR